MGVHKIATAVLELITDASKYDKGIDAAVKKLTAINFDNARKSLNSYVKEHDISMATVAKGFGAAVAGVGALAVGLIALGQRGAGVADVRGEFDRLTGSVGSTSDAMLGKLRQGTLGTLSDFELMKIANAAMSNGFLKSADDAGVLAAGAKALADRTGGDTVEAFDALMKAIETGKTAQLKQYGLFVDTKTAVDAYAKAHNLAVGDLTDRQRAEALSAAAIAELRKQTEAAGAATKDFGDWIDWGKAKVMNFVNGLGEAIATSPVVQAGMEAIGASLGAAFGGDQQALVRGLMGWVNSFAIMLTHVAEAAVYGARVMMNAWHALKIAFSAIMTGIYFGLEMITKGIALVVEAAARLPLIGDQFQGMATGARDTANRIEGMRQSFQQQTSEALDNAAAQNAMLDKVRDTIQGVRGAMISARAAQDKANATTQAGTGANEKLGKATVNTAGATRDLSAATDAAAGAIGQKTLKEKEAEKVTAEHEKRIKALTEALSGTDAKQKANDYILALNRIKDLHKLTKERQEEVLAVMTAALEVYRLTGERAPAEIQKVYDALVRLVLLPQLLKESNKAFADEVAANQANLRDKVNAQIDAMISKQQEAKKTARDIIDEVYLASLTATERKIALAQRERDESIKAIEPIRTAFPAIYEAALRGIEQKYTESIGRQKLTWDDFKKKFNETMLGGQGIKGILGMVADEVLPGFTAKFKFAKDAWSAVSRAFAGDWSGVMALAQQHFAKLIEFVGKGVKKIAGWFKEAFGGPNAKELAGREVAAEFKNNLAGMMNERQKMEAGNNEWAKSVIVVRDAYLAMGKTEAEALAAMDRLWKAEKEGAGAVEEAIKPIQAALDFVKTKSEETGLSLDELRAKGVQAGSGVALSITDATRKLEIIKSVGDRVANGLRESLGNLRFNIPVDFSTPDGAFGGLPVHPMANGGVGRVTRPTLFLAGERGAEDFAFSGGGRGFGSSARAASGQMRAQVFMDGREVGYALLEPMAHALRASL